MDLVAFSLKGWRRFRNRTTLQTNGKIVSLLGPNEAGKSSVLRALQFLRSGDEIDPKDISRGMNEADVELIGYFALDKTEIEGAKLPVPTRLKLTKKAAGVATFVLEPPAPPRDTSLRDAVAEQIDKCLSSPKFVEALSDEDFTLFEGLQETLEDAESDLPSDWLGRIDALADAAGKINFPKAPQYVRSLGDKLSALSENEKQSSPHDHAISYLRGRIPQILLFGDDERDLRQEYNIDSLNEGIPTALANLSSIADLDIPKLVAAVDAGDVAEIESLKAQANHKLRLRFEETWSQSGVHVSITVTNRILNVVIENEPLRFTNLAERSDGFRQFVALQSFTMKAHANRPILLIDEAELHLHYDAQADTVQMLSRQEVASKIIYTTHSAGCLPEDLGNGVRLISQVDASTSAIINRFWGTAQPGFSPMLIGMGASTLAFFPTRKALMVEGESEMLLLPTLLRSVLGIEVLGFQTVPGLSKANKGMLPLTSGEANHVAYLVDGDEGGRGLARELSRNHIEERAVFSLAEVSANCQFEDLLSPKVLEISVNEIIRKFSPGARSISIRQLPATGRFAHLAAAFKRSTKKELAKTDLAYEVLDVRANAPDTEIVDPNHSGAFQKLATRISKFLA